MTDQLEKYVEQTFEVECKGRDSLNKEVLKEPVKVEVNASKRAGSNLIETLVNCPYISGGHGDKCKAFGEGDKRGSCTYAISLGSKNYD